MQKEACIIWCGGEKCCDEKLETLKKSFELIASSYLRDKKVVFFQGVDGIKHIEEYDTEKDELLEKEIGFFKFKGGLMTEFNESVEAVCLSLEDAKNGIWRQEGEEEFLFFGIEELEKLLSESGRLFLLEGALPTANPFICCEFDAGETFDYLLSRIEITGHEKLFVSQSESGEFYAALYSSRRPFEDIEEVQLPLIEPIANIFIYSTDNVSENPLVLYPFPSEVCSATEIYSHRNAITSELVSLRPIQIRLNYSFFEIQAAGQILLLIELGVWNYAILNNIPVYQNDLLVKCHYFTNRDALRAVLDKEDNEEISVDEVIDALLEEERLHFPKLGYEAMKIPFFACYEGDLVEQIKRCLHKCGFTTTQENALPAKAVKRIGTIPKTATGIPSPQRTPQQKLKQVPSRETIPSNDFHSAEFSSSSDSIPRAYSTINVNLIGGKWCISPSSNATPSELLSHSQLITNSLHQHRPTCINLNFDQSFRRKSHPPQLFFNELLFCDYAVQHNIEINRLNKSLKYTCYNLYDAVKPALQSVMNNELIKTESIVIDQRIYFSLAGIRLALELDKRFHTPLAGSIKAKKWPCYVSFAKNAETSLRRLLAKGPFLKLEKQKWFYSLDDEAFVLGGGFGGISGELVPAGFSDEKQIKERKLKRIVDEMCFDGATPKKRPQKLINIKEKSNLWNWTSAMAWAIRTASRSNREVCFTMGDMEYYPVMILLDLLGSHGRIRAANDRRFSQYKVSEKFVECDAECVEDWLAEQTLGESVGVANVDGFKQNFYFIK